MCYWKKLLLLENEDTANLQQPASIRSSLPSPQSCIPLHVRLEKTH